MADDDIGDPPGIKTGPVGRRSPLSTIQVIAEPSLDPSRNGIHVIDVEGNSEDNVVSQLKQPRGGGGNLCGRARCCFPLVCRVRKASGTR